MLSCSEQLSPLACATNIILPLGVFGILTTISRRIGFTVFVMFPFMFFAAFQIVLHSLYGNGIISVDMFLNVLTTNETEVQELLGRMRSSLLVVSALYIPLLVLGLLCVIRRWILPITFIKHNRKIFYSITIFGVIGLCCSYAGNYDVRHDLYPVNIGYNLYLTKIRNDRTRDYPETSSSYKFYSQATHDEDIKETYVVVIGETSRAFNWELLGYNRPTNPLLSKRGDLIVMNEAYSESNTTHKSVPMLLSVVDSHTYNNELHKVKSLITAFKEAGFHTVFLSNQMPNHSYIDYFGKEADTVDFVKIQSGQNKFTTDDVLLNDIDKSLKSGHKKQLIVVHTYGSHFNYRDRYLNQDRVFLPDDYKEASKSNRPLLLNAYDNSIIATDRFLNSVIQMLEHGDGVSSLSYTSDHGEDIFEDGNRFLHASPTPTENQLHIPLFFWLSEEYSNRYPTIIENLKSNKSKYISSSRSFCPTIISIAGIITDKVNCQDDMTSISYKERELYYLNDHNEPIIFKTYNK